MAATVESKHRGPKAIAVTKLIGGKLVTTLAKSELDKLARVQQLCAELAEIAEWKAEATAACEALDTLITKCGT